MIAVSHVSLPHPAGTHLDSRDSLLQDWKQSFDVDHSHASETFRASQRGQRSGERCAVVLTIIPDGRGRGCLNHVGPKGGHTIGDEIGRNRDVARGGNWWGDYSFPSRAPEREGRRHEKRFVESDRRDGRN